MTDTWRSRAVSADQGQPNGPAREPSAPVQAPATDWRNRAVSPDSGQAPLSGEVRADPDRSAGFFRNFIAGPMNPDQQIRYFAQERFPDMPIDEAMGRYGVTDDKRVYYTGDDGQRYLESTGAASTLGRTTSEMIPGVAGAAGFAVTGGPVSPITGAAGGALAAGGARYGQELLADYMSGEPSSTVAKTQEAIGEAALDVAGTGAGALIAKGVNSKVLKQLAGRARQSAQDLMVTAKRDFGIDLSWAEASNLKSLIQRQQYLNRAPGSMDPLYDRYLARMPQIRQAVDNFIDSLGGSGSAVQAADDVIGAARSSIDKLKTARTTQTAPLYRAAYAAAPTVDASSVRAAIGRQMQNATGSYKSFLREKLGELGDAASVSSEKLHNIRQDLDAAMRGQLTRYADIQPRDVQQIEALRAPIDNVLKGVPGFQAADAEFARLSGPIDQAAREMTGQIANKRLPDIASLSNQLFNGKAIDLDAFKAVRDRIYAESPEAWQSMVRWHLATQWDTVTRRGAPGEVRNLGTRFVRAIWGAGDDKQAALMRAALDHEPDAKRALTTLVDVLNATGRALYEGSPTQPLQAQAREAASEAMSASPIGRVAQTGRLASFEALPRVAQWVQEMLTGAYNARLADALFDPNFQQAMAQVRRSGPKTQVGIQATMRALLQGADAVTGASEQIGSLVPTGAGARPQAAGAAP